MSKGRDRTVFRRDGDWVNKRNDADRASRACVQLGDSQISR